MIVLRGWYHWFPKRRAFRRDYCRSCGSETTSVLVRTVDVMHVFWIPILPIGAWSRWFCGACGARPHAATATRRGFKIAGALILLLMSVAAWFVSEADDIDLATLWVMRLGSPIALFFTIKSIVFHAAEPALEARLARVQPYSSHECPLCGGMLVTGSELSCSQCGARHLPLQG